jgi:small-conductance mechanosensitive channel
LRGLVAVFPLSIVSFFFLDVSLSFIFTEHWLVPPANVSAWLMFFSVLRAVFAEWVMSSVVGFSGSRSSLKRVTGFSVALVLYGVPLLAVSEPVRSPLSPIVLSLLEWGGEVLNVRYLPSFAAAVVSFTYLTLLLDFSRLALYLCIKRWIRSRVDVFGEEEEITPMLPRKVVFIYFLAIIVLYVFNMFILVPFPRLDCLIFV